MLVHGHAAHNLPAHLPLAGQGDVLAPLEGLVPVHHVRPDGDDPAFFQIAGHGAADIGVLHHVAVGGDEDLDALALVELLLRPDGGFPAGLVLLLGLTVGPVDLPEGAAQPPGHGEERGLLPLPREDVHLVGEDLDPLPPEDVPCQVGQGLKAGTHVAVPPETADPGDQHIVAASRQGRHMAQENFQGQARLVNGQGRACVHDPPVRGAAEHCLDAQLVEKGLPERPIAVVQQSLRQPDDHSMFFHVCFLLIVVPAQGP